MSGGTPCRCEPRSRKGWWVRHWRCNYSAFSGYHYTPSDYSNVVCASCGATWRTKAAYVESLPLQPPGAPVLPLVQW